METPSFAQRARAWLQLFFITRLQYGLFSTMDTQKIIQRMLEEGEVSGPELELWCPEEPIRI